MSKSLSDLVLGSPEQQPDDGTVVRRGSLSEAVLGSPDPLNKVVGAAKAKSSDVAARVLKVQGRTGAPPEFIERNLEELETKSSAKDFDSEKFRRESPSLASWLLEHPKHAELANDDMEQMGAIEWMLTAPGRAYAQGTAQVEFGKLSAQRLSRDLTSSEQTRLDELRTKMSAGGELGAGNSWFRGAITGAAQQLPMLFGGLGAGFEGGAKGAVTFGTGAAIAGQLGPQIALPEELLTVPAATLTGYYLGQTAGAAGFGFDVEAGNAFDEYSQMKDESGQPLDRNVAKAAAIAAGVANAGLEALQINTFLRSIPGAKNLTGAATRGAVKEALKSRTVRTALFDLMKGYTGTLTKESLTEVAQRASTIVFGELGKTASGQDIPHREAGDIATDLANEFTGAIQSFALTVAPGHAMQAVSDVRQAQQSQKNGEYFKALGEGVKNSKTFERLPSALQDLVKRATKDGPIENVYLPIDDVNSFAQEHQLDPEKLMEAVTENGAAKYKQAIDSVEVPMADFAATIARSEHSAFFQDVARLGSPSEMNAREGKAFLDAKTKEDAEQRAADPEGTAALDASEAKIYDDVVGQMMSQGESDEVVHTKATYIANQYRAIGERAGLDPYEVFAGTATGNPYDLKVVRPLPEILRSVPNLDVELDTMIDRLRTGKVTTQQEMFGVSLVDFVRNLGGVKDFQGDLASLEPDVDRAPFQSNLIQPETGMELDRAREAAAEEGYLPNESTIADFLDLLDNEFRGTPVYAQGRENPEAISESLKLGQLDQYLQERGVDLASASNAEVKALIQQARTPARSIDAVSGTVFDQKAYVPIEQELQTAVRIPDVVTIVDIPTTESFADATGQELRARARSQVGRLSQYRDARKAPPGQVRNRHTGWSVDLWIDGLKKSANFADRGERLVAFERLPDLIREATYLRTAADREDPNAPPFDYLYTPFSWNGRTYIAKMALKQEVEAKGRRKGQRPDKRFYSLHALSVDPAGRGPDYTSGAVAEATGAGRQTGEPAGFDPDLQPRSAIELQDLTGPLGATAEAAGTSGTAPTISKAALYAFVNEARETTPLFQSDVLNLEKRGTFSFLVLNKKGDVVWRGIDQEEGRHLAEETAGHFGTIVELLAKANLSTFIHEMAHFNLEVMGDLVEHLKDKEESTLTAGQRQLISDYDTVLLPFLGATSRSEIKREHHELYARASEAYARRGESPNPELRRIFYRFKSWLKQVYESLTELNVTMTPEVIGYFNRLNASDAQIAQAESDAHSEALIESDEAAARLGMPAKEYALYRKDVEVGRQARIEKLEAEYLAEAERYQSARWHVREKEVRAEVTQAVHSQRGYLALSYIKNGTLPDGSPLPEGVPLTAKLDQKALEKRTSGKGSRIEGKGSTVMNALLRLGVYQRKGGASPDAVADLLGYSSGDELINALGALRPMNELIDAETADRMRLEYGNIDTDGTAAQHARDAVMTEGRVEVLEAEQRALARAQRKAQPFVALGIQKEREAARARQRSGADTYERFVLTADAARFIADSRVQEGGVRELKPGTFFAAAQRASKAAADAFLKLNYAEALKQKQRQTLATAMYEATTEAKKQIENSREKFATMFRPDSKIAPTRNMDYVNGARAIAAALMFPNKRANVAEAMDLVRKYDPDLYETIREKVAGAVSLSAKQDYRDLTVSQFVGASDTALTLWTMAKREGQMRIDGKLITKQAAIDALLAHTSTLSSRHGDAGVHGLSTTFEHAERNFVSLKGWLRRVESWVTAMDGGHQGPYRTYIWDPVKEAVNTFRVEKVRVMDIYVKSLEPILDTFTNEKISAPELNYTFGRDKSGGRAELLGALLHAGNRNDLKSNLAKLVVGRGWGAIGADGTIDYSKWDAFIHRMQAEGVLSKKDYDFVQGVWDLFEGLKPGLQATHKEVYGTYFKEVPADAVSTPWGAYRGGYVPAIADPITGKGAISSRNEKQMTFESGTSWALPSAGLKSTIGRVAVYEPLAMNLAFIPQHVDWALRFTHIQPAVKDVARIVTDRKFRPALDGHDPHAGDGLLMPWLMRAATQRVNERGRSPLVDKVFNALRTRMGLQVLTLSVGNALQQTLGASLTLIKVHPRHLAKAAWHYTRRHTEVADLIRAKSPFMQTFLTSQAMEIQRQIDNILLNPSVYARSSEFLRANSQFLAEGTQNMVNHISWLGAYNQATENNPDDKAAVLYADSVIRETQGSFFPEDISRMDANTPAIRAINMFSSYFGMTANLLVTEGGIALRSDRGAFAKAGRATAVVTLGLLLPSVLSNVMLNALSGDWGDDDDSYLDYFLAYLVAPPLKTAAAALPLVGAGISAAYNALATDSSYDDDIRISPILGLLGSGVKDLGGGSTKQRGRDFLSILGIIVNQPLGALNRPAGYLLDIHDGKANPENVIDLMRGLVSGRTPQ